jgi:hypothetical protein
MDGLPGNTCSLERFFFFFFFNENDRRYVFHGYQIQSKLENPLDKSSVWSLGWIAGLQIEQFKLDWSK